MTTANATTTGLEVAANTLLEQVSRDDLAQSFAARALRAVGQLAKTLPRQEILQALAEEADLDVLIHAFGDSGILAAGDPLRAARARGIAAQRHLLTAEGGAWTADEAAHCLGISRQAVNKRRTAGRLLAVPSGRGFLYPAWQFGAGRTLEGLEEALTELENEDVWMQLRFFLSPAIRLGDRTPLSVLRDGEREAVIAAARVYGEHGAD